MNKKLIFEKFIPQERLIKLKSKSVRRNEINNVVKTQNELNKNKLNFNAKMKLMNSLKKDLSLQSIKKQKDINERHLVKRIGKIF
ncbi:hypothetical protein NUSPORA_02242 [Nucleospora cyclopteri]